MCLLFSCTKTSGPPSGIQFTLNGTTYLFNSPTGFVDSSGTEIFTYKTDNYDTAMLTMYFYGTGSGTYGIAPMGGGSASMTLTIGSTSNQIYNLVGDAKVTISNNKIAGSLTGNFYLGTQGYTISNGTINCPITP